MEITRRVPEASPGPAEWFTGLVELAELAAPGDPSRLRVVWVSFAPGARTAWHTHPLGQAIHIVEGAARVGRTDEAPADVPAGGTIWFAPGERHWHGATPGERMVHIAIQELGPDGTAADWAEHVSDPEYHGAPSNRRDP
jgi:quercetin dioxygenase-like cupin family protein